MTAMLKVLNARIDHTQITAPDPGKNMPGHIFLLMNTPGLALPVHIKFDATDMDRQKFEHAIGKILQVTGAPSAERLKNWLVTAAVDESGEVKFFSSLFGHEWYDMKRLSNWAFSGDINRQVDGLYLRPGWLGETQYNMQILDPKVDLSEHVAGNAFTGSSISMHLHHGIGTFRFTYRVPGNDDARLAAAMRYIANSAGTNHWSDVHKRCVRVLTRTPVLKHDAEPEVLAIGHLLEDRWIQWQSFQFGSLESVKSYLNGR